MLVLKSSLFKYGVDSTKCSEGLLFNHFYVQTPCNPLIKDHTEILYKARMPVKLLLALASTVILGSKSHGFHDHILLSDGFGSLQTTATLTRRSMTQGQGQSQSLLLGLIENTASSIVASLSVAEEKCLPRSRLATAASSCTILAASCHITILKFSTNHINESNRNNQAYKLACT
jgi:hypothetical protein